jgi:hypothetical protein
VGSGAIGSGVVGGAAAGWVAPDVVATGAGGAAGGTAGVSSFVASGARPGIVAWSAVAASVGAERVAVCCPAIREASVGEVTSGGVAGGRVDATGRSAAVVALADGWPVSCATAGGSLLVPPLGGGLTLRAGGGTAAFGGALVVGEAVSGVVDAVALPASPLESLADCDCPSCGI